MIEFIIEVVITDRFHCITIEYHFKTTHLQPIGNFDEASLHQGFLVVHFASKLTFHINLYSDFYDHVGGNLFHLWPFWLVHKLPSCIIHKCHISNCPSSNIITVIHKSIIFRRKMRPVLHAVNFYFCLHFFYLLICGINKILICTTFVFNYVS